jgi:hypothetical protein
MDAETDLEKWEKTSKYNRTSVWLYTHLRPAYRTEPRSVHVWGADDDSPNAGATRKTASAGHSGVH